MALSSRIRARLARRRERRTEPALPRRRPRSPGAAGPCARAAGRGRDHHVAGVRSRPSPADCRSPPRWSWRVILVVIVLWGLAWMSRYLSEVMVPLAVAVLLAAMLSPVANRLNAWGLPRGAATAITVLGGLA